MGFLKRRHGYEGPERRHHRVFRTLNSEYHCRDDVCVAVRDLRTGEFVDDHPAIGQLMSGGIAFDDEGGIRSFSLRGQDPHPGESLFFADEKRQRSVRTSALRSVERPPKAIVEHYRR